MSDNELQKVYNHATDMLYNNNKYTPGKFQVKKNIRALIAQCNAELLKRYILHECNIDILNSIDKPFYDIIHKIIEYCMSHELNDLNKLKQLHNEFIFFR